MGRSMHWGYVSTSSVRYVRICKVPTSQKQSFLFNKMQKLTPINQIIHRSLELTVSYIGNGTRDIYPKIYHERGFQRMTSRFHAKPGVGQNIAWALTKHVNFTKIIDDLWYRDIANIQPGYIKDFQVFLQLVFQYLLYYIQIYNFVVINP